MQTNTARALPPLAVFFLLSACGSVSPQSSPPTARAAMATFTSSPNIIIGRVLSVDHLRHFAIIDLVSSAPTPALAPDHELLARTDDLHVTAHLRATRQLRGHTLGTVIISGAPNLGDEVVFPVSP